MGSLKMNTALEYSTRVVQEGDRRCKKSTLNDLAYLSPLRIPLMNPVIECIGCGNTGSHLARIAGGKGWDSIFFYCDGSLKGLTHRAEMLSCKPTVNCSCNCSLHNVMEISNAKPFQNSVVW